jgi:hypothetical protein
MTTSHYAGYTPAPSRYCVIVLAKSGKATSGSSMSGCQFFSHTNQ